MKTIYKILIIFIVGLVIGFFIGRCTINTETKIEYVKGETIRDTTRIPPPYKIEIPKIIYLPQKPIFINGDSVFITDTVGVFRDYSSIKYYAMSIFNDKEIGKLDIKQQIQYNQLKEFSYDFTPIHRNTTRKKEKAFTPYIGMSYSTNDYVGIGGGAFIKNIGLEYKFNLSTINAEDNKSYHTIGLNMKF